MRDLSKSATLDLRKFGTDVTEGGAGRSGANTEKISRRFKYCFFFWSVFASNASFFTPLDHHNLHLTLAPLSQPEECKYSKYNSKTSVKIQEPPSKKKVRWRTENSRGNDELTRFCAVLFVSFDAAATVITFRNLRTSFLCRTIGHAGLSYFGLPKFYCILFADFKKVGF